MRIGRLRHAHHLPFPSEHFVGSIGKDNTEVSDGSDQLGDCRECQRTDCETGSAAAQHDSRFVIVLVEWNVAMSLHSNAQLLATMGLPNPSLSTSPLWTLLR
jgi:hypothetical protein